MDDKIESSFKFIRSVIPDACNRMNTFSSKILRTRGGRIGSGMGALLEALWGYMMNQILIEFQSGYEIAWFPDNQYNDFACLLKNTEWNIRTRSGEMFRIEAKSMNIEADESKAHFDVIKKELEDYDSLLILVWEWKPIDQFYYSPTVRDFFFDRSIPITQLRDELHLARNGSFVNKNHCPDFCLPANCSHEGEPLNASGKRERISGPEATRPSPRVSYAANFGGLVRMLKTDNDRARAVFRRVRKMSPTAHSYISFIFRNYQDEERNQYTTSEIKKVASSLGISTFGLDKDGILAEIRRVKDYEELFRDLL